MNFIIKSIAYWVIAVIIMTMIGSMYDNPPELQTNALKQFENTTEPVQAIKKIETKRNSFEFAQMGLWVLILAGYGFMFYDFYMKLEKSLEEEK